MVCDKCGGRTPWSARDALVPQKPTWGSAPQFCRGVQWSRATSAMPRQLIVRIAAGFVTLAPLFFGQVSIEPRRRPVPKEAPAIPSSNLRVDTNLVLVPVTVNDEFNHPVTSLEKENFRIFDDAVPQSISAFSTEDAPIA